MRKIAHLITGLDVGGAEQTLLDTLPRLQVQDLRHTVYCVIGHGHIGDKLQKMGIPVFYLNYKGWLDLIPMALRLWRALKSARPDILVTYLIHADLLGRLMAPLAGINKVITFRHGALLQWEFLKHVDKMTSFLVTHYVAVSDVLKNKLVNDGVIANLRKGKGHHDLLLAFNQLLQKKHSKKLILLIVGGGEERASLEKLTIQLHLTENVIFTGYRDDIPNILKTIDIFVLPTYFEGKSIALLEAMAARKPIITTSIPENLEILAHNETALLVPPGNINALSNALLKLIEQTTLRDRLNKRAYAECAQKYDINKTVLLFKKILLEL
ncbi:MAG: Glycosyl transferase group 1 [Parcubacteria group bacterium GW2011_GWA2_46_9]|nr:MAG: Glycosyl transferase group 1 [Parcubacteria group bacterium GW2011_GWA2_46_9]